MVRLNLWRFLLQMHIVKLIHRTENITLLQISCCNKPSQHTMGILKHRNALFDAFYFNELRYVGLKPFHRISKLSSNNICHL